MNYLLVCYRPNRELVFRGERDGSSDSDLEFLTTTDSTTLVNFWAAKLLETRNAEREYADWNYTLFIDGIRYYNDGDYCTNYVNEHEPEWDSTMDDHADALAQLAQDAYHDLLTLQIQKAAEEKERALQKEEQEKALREKANKELRRKQYLDLKKEFE